MSSSARLGREGVDRTDKIRGVAIGSSRYRDTELRRGRLQRGEIDAGGNFRIIDQGDSGDGRRGLLEQLQPLAAERGKVVGGSGGISLRL